MKKTILIMLLVVCFILLMACDNIKLDNIKTNETQDVYFFGGEPVTFELDKTNITLNDEIIIASANYTGEIYMLSFCDVPFNILKKQEVDWKYVYPEYLECSEPTNITFLPGMSIKVRDIPVQKRYELTPGTYMLRIYYSTFGPMEYLREYNIIMDIN